MSKRFLSRLLFSIAGIILPITLIWGSSTFQSLNASSSDFSIESVPSIVQPAIATEVSSDDDTILAGKVAKVFLSACPLTEPGDNIQREQCANKLAKSKILQQLMPDEVRWGGKKSLVIST
jgi:hypothetical protein